MPASSLVPPRRHVLVLVLALAAATAAGASSSPPYRRALLQKTPATATKPAAPKNSTTTTKSTKPTTPTPTQPPTPDQIAARTLSATAQANLAVVRALSPFQPSEPTPVAAAEGVDPGNVGGGSASVFAPGNGPATAIAQAAPFQQQTLYGFGGNGAYGATLGGPNPFFYGGSGGAWGWTGGRFATGR